MSFSQKTKNELSKLPIEDICCSLAELSALVRMCGTIKIAGSEKINLKFSTENASIARRIFSILKKSYDVDIEVMVRRNRQLKKNNNYLIAIGDRDISKKILLDVGFIKEKENNIFNPDYKIEKDIIEKRCCRRSYIRGSFLGGGSISNPEKTYHLEMVTNNKEHAENLSEIINSFNLNAKIVLRKDNYIVYLKEGEQIVDILNIMGAHQALLELEDVRVLKDVRNNINRIVNCETANLSKTISASLRQINDIELIESRMGLIKLPKNLREVASLRLDNPDASLKEIGMMLDSPVGKSGVNHRFRKIGEIAEELRGGR
ncbi:DNA-binding protein WhiA [Tissierella creatinophila]|uniref:Probable cell division protein WhiA n=1 Tax=Tissierella creatinophila DSM 6911 TaxID=1123403 RepID=A0A1U7M7W9_TISCR|nr:DNA-binding protein WhiA [Tissierella creatinophila]OLS03298.1 sporulation transcription regulator WhiA [Tissierella creatinophila DSM 6911]